MALTHTLKTVRRHHIDLRVPPLPASDAEVFVLNVKGQGAGGELELTPGDFLTLIGILGKCWTDVTGQELRTKSELRARQTLGDESAFDDTDGG